MRREQEGLLLLLKELDEICRANDITYYVSGGTVIGAARHEGFIPWDDDVDVYMTRDNWNRFREVMKTQIPDMRALECWEDHIEFNNLLGRYMNEATTQIHKFQLYNAVAMGQLVDLFVLDPMICDDEAIKQYRKDVMLASDLINDFAVYSDRAVLCEEYEPLRDRMDREGREKVIREVVTRLEKYDEDNSDCYILRWGGIPHVFPKEMFGEPKYLKFEDMVVPVPTRMCDYLTQLYGLDWMYIPPHGERLVHTDIFDPDQPFRRFADLILPRVKNTETGTYLVNRKKEVFNNLQFTHDLDKEQLLMEGNFVKRKLFSQIEEKGIDLVEAASLSDLGELRDLVKDYIRMQTQKSFIGGDDFYNYYKKANPVFIDIGDKLLAVSMRVMIQEGRISKAFRLMQIRENEVSRPLETCLEDIKYMLNGLRTVQTLFEFNRLSEAEELLDSISEREDNIEVYKYRLEMLQRKNGGSSAEEFKCLLDECLNKWPEDGDFHKYKGDEHYDAGDVRGAIEEYTEMLLKSSNGLFILDIGKRINSNKAELISFIKEKIDSADHAAEITKAWKGVFDKDHDVIGLYIEAHIDRKDPFAKIFAENTFAGDEGTVEAICEAYAKGLGWSKENVRFILEEKGLLKAGGKNFNSSDDNRDISRYINAVMMQKNGDVKQAYEIYLQLLHSEDPYVSKCIREKLESDHKLFIQKKTNEEEHYFDLDYQLKYGDLPYEEYLKLLKEAEESAEKTEEVQADFDSQPRENPWFMLLAELVDICSENGVEYFLGGEILHYLGDNADPLPHDFNSMEIIVDGKNAKKLMEACRKLPPGRALECVLNTPKLRSPDMFYINTESTGIDFRTIDRRRSLGISITIRIARPQGKSFSMKKSALFDKLWMVNYGYHYRVLKLDEKEKKQNKRFIKMNRDGDIATLKNFKSNLDQEIKKDTEIIYIYSKSTRIMHNAKLWREKQERELFGMKVVAPKNADRYLNSISQNDRSFIAKQSMIIDEAYADHEGEKEIYNNGAFWGKIEKNRQYTFSKRDQAKEFQYNWKMANDIFDGINAEDQFRRDYDRLKGIYDKKAYTELMSQIDGYRKVIMLKKKYNIEIDSDLEQLYYNTKEQVQ